MDIPNVEFKPQVNNIGIEIFELDRVYKKSTLDHDPSTPHRVEFNCLIYIKKGQGNHFIDFHRYPVEAGSLVLVNKNQVHAFDFKHKPKGKVILFTDNFVESARVNIRTPIFSPTYLATSHLPVLNLNSRVRTSVEALLLEIEKEQENPQCEEQLIQLLFTSLLIIFTRERPDVYSHHISESRAQKFVQFMRLIENEFISTRDASVYADKMHMTYKSLNQICKLACNQTAKQLIDARTVLEVKRKLIVEQPQIQSLAYDLGFDEVTNFVKYFKKHTQLTPSQFKDSIKG